MNMYTLDFIVHSRLRNKKLPEAVQLKANTISSYILNKKLKPYDKTTKKIQI